MSLEFEFNKVHQGDALQVLKTFESDSIDSIVTDPPYGYAFMNKDWDRVVVGAPIWKECLRVLKPGAFAFIMSSPRQDVLSRMIVNLQDAGFETGFTSLYWTYASGFPKAANVSKLVDKRNGRFENERKELARFLKDKIRNSGYTDMQIREHLGISLKGGGLIPHWITENSQPTTPILEHWNKLKEIIDLGSEWDWFIEREEAERNKIPSTGNLHKNDLTHGWSTMPKKEEYLMSDNVSITEQAKALDGSYAGFQPKPAVEIVLVVMKPLSEKSYVDQALANKKGVTWLDDCRIPYQNEDEIPPPRTSRITDIRGNNYGIDSENKKFLELKNPIHADQKGRFPANLLVSDDVLNDGALHSSGKFAPHHRIGPNKTTDIYGKFNQDTTAEMKKFYGDSGSYSRYFDLDKWFDTTFPFLICAKASKAERNMGLITSYMGAQKVNDGRHTPIDNPFQRGETLRVNVHPTVKPIKLMSYLIMLGSREDDTILDPFCGSGTTLIVAKMLKRHYVGIEINNEYCKITESRLQFDCNSLQQQSIYQYLIPN